MDRATIDVYEAHSTTYESRRTPRFLQQAQRFGSLVTSPPAIDLGSGPGWYSAALGTPVVALDAARSMLRRTREVAPSALPVQADLQSLPFRRGSLGGGWARNTYVHLRSTELPMALADLHRSLNGDAPVELTFFAGAGEGWEVFPDDDLPGRWFSTWSESRLVDVLSGAGFVLDELERRDEQHNIGLTFRGRRAPTLPDTVGAGMRLLVCGLNPSVRAAQAGIGFVTPGNRYWAAAIAAGLVSRDRDPWHAIREHGVGMTDLVKRASPRADVLARSEYASGVARLDRLCEWLQPGSVCLVGLAGWRAAVEPRAAPGWQPRELGGRPVYVMPSTSGANAATSLSALTDHLRAAVRP